MYREYPAVVVDAVAAVAAAVAAVVAAVAAAEQQLLLQLEYRVCLGGLTKYIPAFWRQACLQDRSIS